MRYRKTRQTSGRKKRSKRVLARLTVFMAFFAVMMLLNLATALAQVQSHRLSEIFPIDTDLDLNVYQLNASQVNSTDAFFSGDVGIGVQDPDSALHISGDYLLVNNSGFGADGKAIYALAKTPLGLGQRSYAVRGETTGGQSGTSAYGVYGKSTGSTSFANHYGGYFISEGTNGAHYGAYGIGTGIGVYGRGNNTGVYGCDNDDCNNNLGRLGYGNYGVYGKGVDAAGYFDGNVTVTGNTSTSYLCLSGDCRNAWPSGGGSGGNVSGAGAANYVAIWANDENLTYDADVYWDNSNNRLGIGTTSPYAKLDVDNPGGIAVWGNGSFVGVYGCHNDSCNGSLFTGVYGALGYGFPVFNTYRGVQGAYNSSIYGYLGGNDGTGVYGRGTNWAGKFENQDGVAVYSRGDMQVLVGGFCVSEGTQCSGQTPGDGDAKIYDGSMCIGDNGCTVPAGDGNLYVEGNVNVTGNITSGTGTVFIDGTNSRIGIGTKNPTYDLDVAGDLGVDEYIYHNDDTDTYIMFWNDTMYLFVGNVPVLYASEGTQDTLVVNDLTYDVDFRVETVGDENALFVQGSDGNVGMGTSNPLSKLSVGGDGSVNASISGHQNCTGNFCENYGVFGSSNCTGAGCRAIGVYGNATSSTGFTYGVLGRGLYGVSGEGTAYGVRGSANTYGVEGRIDSGTTSNTTYAGYFYNNYGNNSYGIYANAGAVNAENRIAVFARSHSTTGQEISLWGHVGSLSPPIPSGAFYSGYFTGAPVRIGSSGTIDYVTSDGDLYVYDDIEVGDDVYIGDELYIYGASSTASGSLLRLYNNRVHTDSSSRRYKEDIQPLEENFYAIFDAEPKSFVDRMSGERLIGYIAEDFDESGLDSLVTYAEDGTPEGVRYDKVSLYNLEIIKDQQEQIQQLKEEVDQLKQAVELLQDK